MVGARRHLRRMGHGERLHAPPEPRQPHPDGVGHRAAHAGVDLVEHQGGRRTLVGDHHLEGEQEARELAAGGDLHQRSRLGARIGAHPEFDAIDAVRTGGRRVGVDRGGEFRPFELERLQFAVDRLVEHLGDAPPALRQRGGRAGIERRRLGGRLLERGETRGARIDQREVAGIAARQRRQIVDRRIVFASRRAQREQPLLEPLEHARILVGGGERLLEMPARIVERRERGVDRLDGRLDQGRRLIAGDLLALHHRGAAFGKLSFLAVPGSQRLQFGGGVAEIVRFAGGALHAGAVRVERIVGGAPHIPQRFKGSDLFLEPREGIEQLAVGGSIDQRALVVLAVDLDQRRAEAFQDLHADRLIVDEGARAPVGELDPPQDQFVLGRDVVVFEHEMRRVPGRHVEGGRHLPLLDTLAHQAGVAARPQRQREGVEQDRLAGAGLAREHGKAAGEIDIEPIDQHDVADREPGQHEHPVAPKWSIESRRFGRSRLVVAPRRQTFNGPMGPIRRPRRSCRPGNSSPRRAS